MRNDQEWEKKGGLSRRGTLYKKDQVLETKKKLDKARRSEREQRNIPPPPSHTGWQQSALQTNRSDHAQNSMVSVKPECR